MPDFLERMEAQSRRRLEAASAVANLEVQRRRAEMRPTLELRGDFLVLAEIKPASPADGKLGGGDHGERARAYAEGGAAAISCLTEPTEFGGSLDLLDDVAGVSPIPVMRKDFVIDPYQVWEARAHGASGILAIVRMIDRAALSSIVATAAEAGMFVLVEAFDEKDLELAAELDSGGARVLIGVNSRDLATLQVRPDAHEALADRLPDDRPAIAESGVGSPERVRAVRSLGYGGVLVGSVLMRADDPAAVVAGLVAAGEPGS